MTAVKYKISEGSIPSLSGSIKALTTALMVFSTALGTALFGLLIDKGYTIEQIALISFVYIFLSLIALFVVRNRLNPEYI